LHAALAANTSTIVKIYDSIRTAVKSVGGTNLDAGCRVAVVTSHHAKVAAGMRKFTLLDVLDPGAKDPDRNLVFLFARHGTGVTANTSVLVNDKAVAHLAPYTEDLENSVSSARPAAWSNRKI